MCVHHLATRPPACGLCWQSSAPGFRVYFPSLHTRGALSPACTSGTPDNHAQAAACGLCWQSSAPGFRVYFPSLHTRGALSPACTSGTPDNHARAAWAAWLALCCLPSTLIRHAHSSSRQGVAHRAPEVDPFGGDAEVLSMHSLVAGLYEVDGGHAWVGLFQTQPICSTAPTWESITPFTPFHHTACRGAWVHQNICMFSAERETSNFGTLAGDVRSLQGPTPSPCGLSACQAAKQRCTVQPEKCSVNIQLCEDPCLKLSARCSCIMSGLAARLQSLADA